MRQLETCFGAVACLSPSQQRSRLAAPLLQSVRAQAPQWLLLPLLTLIFIGSAVATGAGLGAVLQRKRLGAMIGAVAGSLLTALFLAIPYLP